MASLQQVDPSRLPFRGPRGVKQGKAAQAAELIQSKFTVIPFSTPSDVEAATLETETASGPNWLMIGGVAVGLTALVGGVWWFGFRKKQVQGAP
jgi:hypothetical protein